MTAAAPVSQTRPRNPETARAIHHGLIAAGFLAIVALAWRAVPHPLVGPVLCAVPVAALIGLCSPVLMATLFIAFSFFRIHEVFPFLSPLKLPLLLALASLAALGAALWLERLRPSWEPLFAPFLAFFAVVTAGMFFGSNFANSFAYWKDTYVKIAVMVFAIAWLVRRPTDFSFLQRMIIGCGVIVAVTALYNKANGIDLVEGTRVSIGRSIGSVLGDPNDLALVLLFPAGFAISAAVGRGLPGPDRFFGAVAFALSGLAVVATQSRGGLLGVVAVTGVIAWSRIRNKALLVGAGAAGLLLLISVAGISERQSGGAHEEGIDDSAMGRLHAWTAAWRMAVASPHSGVGLDNFYYNYYLYSDFWDGKNHAVHSTWFGVLGETGFIGFGLFLWLTTAALSSVASSRRRLRKGGHPVARSAAEGLTAALAGFCVSGTFLTQGFTWPLYIMIGMAAALARCAQENSHKQ